MLAREIPRVPCVIGLNVCAHRTAPLNSKRSLHRERKREEAERERERGHTLSVYKSPRRALIYARRGYAFVSRQSGNEPEGAHGWLVKQLIKTRN